MTRNGSVDVHERTLLLHPRTTTYEDFHPPQQSPYLNDSRFWVRWPANVVYLTWATLASNYVNVLLVFVPLGIVSGVLQWSSVTVFVLNFLAIIPLASLLSFATEELAAVMGQTLGGLMNATFGNAVELIVRRLPVQYIDDRLTNDRPLGKHCRLEGRPDPCRPSEYARKHPVQYTASAWLLFLGRWHSLP